MIIIHCIWMCREFFCPAFRHLQCALKQSIYFIFILQVLKSLIPYETKGRRLSKKHIVQLATDYIKDLRQLLKVQTFSINTN